MMAFEGPFIAAVIARLADPKYNLAAYGVAFAFALIIEAPIIMIMSASVALVKDPVSYVKVRNFTFSLNLLITFIMLIVLTPGIFDFITVRLMNLPSEIADLTHIATLILLPWPGAIGYRRFYQGILISDNLTRRVAYGTMVRLITMTSTGLILFTFADLPGAFVGASALSIGVILEAVASRLMAAGSIRRILHPAERSVRAALTPPPIRYRNILKYYYPLALSSMIALGVNPLVSFFLGRSRLPIESLAVLPVVTSLSFIFVSAGLSYQEVGLALLGADMKGYANLRKFALILGVMLTAGVSAFAFTFTTNLWFLNVSGLKPELASLAKTAFQYMILMPGLMVLLSLQRSILMVAKQNHHVTISAAIEVLGLLATLFILIHFMNFIGAIAATLSFPIGRSLANIYLYVPCAQALKRTRQNIRI